MSHNHKSEPSVKWPLGCDYDFGVVLDGNDKEVIQIRNIGTRQENDNFASWVVATLNAKAKEEGLY